MTRQARYNRIAGCRQQCRDRYSHIERWARNRYTVGNRLILSTGNVPTRYSLIEYAAWERYIINDGERA